MVWKFEFLAYCAYQKFGQLLLDAKFIAPDFAETLDMKDENRI
jgi:hypothetical protein